MARSTLCCGELYSLLIEEDDKSARRKGCKEQLAQADRLGLIIPDALRERARQAVLLSLKD